MGEDFQYGLTYGDAHFHLVEDDAALEVVGEVAGDFYAAVDGAGMHDERAVFGVAVFFRVEAVEVEVFAHGGDEAALHAFGLQA